MRRWILIFALIMSIFCTSNRVMAEESQDKWLIYWYVCGSDLESGIDSRHPERKNAGDPSKANKELKDNVALLREAVDNLINVIDDRNDVSKAYKRAVIDVGKAVDDLDETNNKLHDALDNFKDVVRDPNKSIDERNDAVKELRDVIYAVLDSYETLTKVSKESMDVASFELINQELITDEISDASKVFNERFRLVQGSVEDLDRGGRLAQISKRLWMLRSLRT